jgi:DNA-binding NarL/FixJ family response regulator
LQFQSPGSTQVELMKMYLLSPPFESLLFVILGYHERVIRESLKGRDSIGSVIISARLYKDYFMTDPAQIRILCVDDHPLLREGIAAILNSQPDMVLVAIATTGSEAIQKFKEHLPDVTLMDLRLPDMSGVDALTAIRGGKPDARIIMLTTFEGDVEIQRSLQAGARAYLLKSMPPKELAEAIRQVHAGKKRIPAEIASHLAEHLGGEALTEREIHVLKHVAGGNRNRDIADLLYISEETVKVHIKHIMEKLGAKDRTEAVAIAVRRGFIEL